MAGLRIRSLLSLVAISLLAASPLFAALQSTAQENSNRGPAQRYTDAQALRQAGELHGALSELESLREDYPKDVDYVLARAQVLAELNRDDDALDELTIGLQLAPDYEDIWILHFNILARQTGRSADVALERFRQDAGTRFPDSKWWQKTVDRMSRWTIIAGIGHEQLSNNQPSWDNQFTELQLEQNNAFRYYARLSRDTRFAGSDTGFSTGVEHTPDSGWIAGLEISTAHSPNFQPKFGFSGHVGKALPDGWVVDLRYRKREYTTTTVSSTVGTVEKYLSDFRIAYSLGLSQLSGSSGHANHILTGNWYFDEKSSIGISLSSGREAESIGNNQVLETDVRGISLTGRQQLNDRLGLLWWLGVHEQGDFYRRRFIGMALSIRI